MENINPILMQWMCTRDACESKTRLPSALLLYLKTRENRAAAAKDQRENEATPSVVRRVEFRARLR